DLVSETSLRLGRASTLGLGKAVDVLDSLGSSMTNLNPSSGFVSGVTTKGNELSILAFEVANTIVKGYSLMQSLSKRSIRQLKEAVLPSKGVQHLVSKDMDDLLQIVANDKREELKIFSGEVVRFGNRCKDPQWHNLDLFFEKHNRVRTPQKQLKEEAESKMQQLMLLVQYTTELYHELHALDRVEHGYQRKCRENNNPYATQRVPDLRLCFGNDQHLEMMNCNTEVYHVYTMTELCAIEHHFGINEACLECSVAVDKLISKAIFLDLLEKLFMIIRSVLKRWIVTINFMCGLLLERSLIPSAKLFAVA
ncbi:unnamed protein product, partial [Ilex paraguariensis]